MPPLRDDRARSTPPEPLPPQGLRAARSALPRRPLADRSGPRPASARPAARAPV